MFKVGDEVVVFYLGSPLQHNSKHNAKHPCRGKILKVGRKKYHVESTGTPMKIDINPTENSVTTLHSVEEAKVLHRANLSKPNEWRTPEFIDEIIERL